ncbi:MAG: hypothetical protein JSS78_09055 [Bacteroidetes bacterium]|nr:hypothetical protein [Bacteroidota bacterium]
MPRNFSKTVHFDKQQVLVVVVPHQRKDGLYFEVNIKGFPRFFMTWSALGRYDIVGDEVNALPYHLVLAVSDMLEKERCK